MEIKKKNWIPINMGILVLAMLFSSVAIFSFPHAVSAAPVTTFLLNGANQDITVNSGGSFTLQVTNANSPVVCYYQTYISGVSSGWITYPCSAYNAPITRTLAYFGITAPGVGYFYFTACDYVTCSATASHYVLANPPDSVLTITKVSVGTVTVQKAAWDIMGTCSPTCSFTYPYTPTTWLQLIPSLPVAVPVGVSPAFWNVGQFVGWSGGGCSGNSSCTIPMSISRNVMAIFDTLTVKAGIDREINLPTNSVTISGASASDTDGSIASLLWTRTSGPSVVTITNGTTLTPSFSNLVVGLYIFRLTAIDNLGRTTSNEISVTVKAANPAPAYGTLWAMGRNYQGTLGLGYSGVYSASPPFGSLGNIFSPTPVEVGTTWQSVSGGYANSAGIMTDGTLWTWGDYVYGELGIDYPFSHYSPVQPLPGTTWKSVSAMGQFSTLAIKSDGTLWTWGWNCFWQLGRNVGLSYTDCSPNTVSYRTPTQVGTDTNWESVQSGDTYSMALKSDGTLWAWGRVDTTFGNCGGYVCYGDTPTPTELFPGTTWRSFAASPYPTGAGIKTDGTLWTWGGNGYGQLGVGDFIDRSSPTQVLPGTTWSSVTMGIGFAGAIKSDGTLWTWGLNQDGSIGLGVIPSTVSYTLNRYPSPMQVLPGTTWSSISAGNFSMMAIKTEGTLWGWGSNYSGQLGLGDTTSRYAPVQVGLRTDWGSVFAGDSFTFAVEGAPLPTIPINITAIPQACGTSQNLLDWDDSANAISYSVYNTDTNAWIGNSIGSTYTHVGSLGATYSYYVRANNSEGTQSANSVTVSGMIAMGCSCTGSIFLNSTVCVNDDTGLLIDTPRTLLNTPSCTATKCEYYCSVGHTYQGGTCVPTQCNDGIDNADTEDVLIDLLDPGCEGNSFDTNETNAPLPPELTTTKTIVDPGPTGVPVDLSWNTKNGNEALCTLTGGILSTNPLDPTNTDVPIANVDTGSTTVTISARTMYTLTCPNGTDTTTIEIISRGTET